MRSINELWGYLIVEELIRNGIDYFVISPGSRSTPLTVAVARHSRAKNIICLDERGAAFHAIGYARATGKPAVLICTSGSAAANYFPAVIEAAIDNVPMIVLSADRPPELRQTGANQTIGQVNLYGDYPTWQFDLPCPTAEIDPKVVLTTIDLAVSKSQQSPGGVVHLNCMFREPLVPGDAHVDVPTSLVQWGESQASYTRYARKLTIPTTAEIESLITTIEHTSKGVLVVGQLKSPAEVEAVSRLAAKLNWAVFADIQSGLRSSDDLPNLVHYFDLLLLTDRADLLTQLDTVIQVGTRIVSARWLKWVEKYPPPNYVAIINDAERHDPSHLVSLRLESDLVAICDALAQRLLVPSEVEVRQRLARDSSTLPTSTWVRELRSASDTIGVSVDKFLKTAKLTEPLVARTISQLIPHPHGLWVANSMPIRDLDLHADRHSNAIRIGANRGTSGIEGAIASATGFAVGLQAPVTAIVGDLSSLHDLNSLDLLRRNLQPVIVIIINNDGGGIFSFLPIAKSTQVFEPYFGTPHGVDFSHAAAMFGIDYYHPLDRSAFVEQYTQALANHRSAIIEVTTDRAENWQFHQDLQAYIQQQFQRD
jgi:2-succinyl-5-enolpyruvyl-6-hydroxy-3-cyclohexene-1-carboxylate synthase